MVASLLELIQVMQKEVMIQIMKLVKYKHLLVNLNKRKRKQNERTKRRNKKLKTLINKSKCLKWIAKKHFTKSQKLKSTQSEIKPIKIGKRPGKRYCFGCKNFTQNFKPQDVKMTNKVLREKSNCVIC